MHLQRFKHQRDVQIGHDGHRVEECKSVCASEGQHPICCVAGGSVVELVSADPVGSKEVDEFADGPVVFAEAVLGAYPKVSVVVLGDAAYIVAWGSGNRA